VTDAHRPLLVTDAHRPLLVTDATLSGKGAVCARCAPAILRRSGAAACVLDFHLNCVPSPGALRQVLFFAVYAGRFRHVLVWTSKKPKVRV